MRAHWKIAATAGSLLLLAGCAAAPPTDNSAEGGLDGFQPCLVSTEGGFNDRSFNEFNLDGINQAADELGVEALKVESSSSDDYASNIDNMIGQGCTLIETLGFAMVDATRIAALANPDIQFLMLDSGLVDENGDALELDNVKPIVFGTRQAAFLAGYAAAATTQTGSVGVYGGLQIPPVVDFMDGFARGVAQYNEAKGTSVEVIGWDVATQEGVFVGGFTDQNAAKTVSTNMFDQGVDVIMPVAGALFQGTLTAMQDRGDDSIAIIGVNSDGYDVAADAASSYLTSVLKNMANATRDAVLQVANDGFDNEPYVGTLENDGVGIAPFHDFESIVPADLADELAALRDQIVDGSLDIG